MTKSRASSSHTVEEAAKASSSAPLSVEVKGVVIMPRAATPTHEFVVQLVALLLFALAVELVAFQTAAAFANAAFWVAVLAAFTTAVLTRSQRQHTYWMDYVAGVLVMTVAAFAFDPLISWAQVMTPDPHWAMLDGSIKFHPLSPMVTAFGIPLANFAADQAHQLVQRTRGHILHAH